MSRMRILLAGVSVLASVCSFVTAQTDTVHFAIDAQRDVKPISRFIYGVNQFHLFFDGLDGPWSNATFTRLGGNRLTAYNWTNNASQAGSDTHFQNDGYLVMGDEFKGQGDAPGGANVPIINLAKDHNAACLLTVPINGYVAADKGPVGDVRTTPNYLSTRFRPEQPRKGSPFTLTPDPNSPVVYQDEFVNWVKTKFAYGQTDPNHPIWFELDNEPDWWRSTHSEIRPKKLTYAELMELTIDYASAIKSIEPNTLVFGPANYGWQGYISLQSASDAQGRDFQEFYLQQLAAYEKSHGQRLVDVLDVHWYPEATGGGIRISRDSDNPLLLQARMDAPRSLWDPTYVEKSWITKKSLNGKAIQLIPRLLDKIARNYPGTKLAITEYDYAGGNNISGAIAEADVLGIFGREGVFAAALWSRSDVPFTAAGFDMFRNFDGNNGSFGDSSIHAETDNLNDSSVYASLDSSAPNRLVIVAINKSDHPINTSMKLDHLNAVTNVEVYQVTKADPKPRHVGQNPASNPGSINYTMPPQSVSTLAVGLVP